MHKYTKSFFCFSRKQVDYYQGDMELPIFSRVTTGYAASCIIRILMLATPANKVSVVQPVAVSENATFIIDLEKVNFCDLKSDDMGAWEATGTKSTYFSFSEPSDTIVFTTKRGARYILRRRYYIHRKYHRMFAVIEGTVS